MPIKIKKVKRELTPEQVEVLSLWTDLGEITKWEMDAFNCDNAVDTVKAINEAYRTHKKALLDTWISQHPGCRPFIWWHTEELPDRLVTGQNKYWGATESDWVSRPIFETDEQYFKKNNLYHNQAERLLCESDPWLHERKV